MTEPSGSMAMGHEVKFSDAAYATVAGFLGWTLDAFDYFLVIVASPQIAQYFHVTTAAVVGSTFITLACRPVGAFIFGLIADRYGRRVPLMIDVIFYSTVEIATVFVPAGHFKTFLVLRGLFGIGMGGEWGVGASLVMEKVPAKWRGILSGLLQEGYAAGYLLAAVAGHFLLKPDGSGWKAMFILGGAPAVLALFVRFGIKESEVWKKSKSDSWSNLGTTLKSHWKIWIYLTILMAAMNLASHGTQDSYTSFMKFRGLSVSTYTDILIVMNVGAIIGGLTFGLASDRLGRRSMMAVAFVGALVMVWGWAYTGVPKGVAAGDATLMDVSGIAIWAFGLQFMVQGAWGIIPAHINELSPDKVRGLLPGFSYQCGNFLASYIGGLQAYLALKHPTRFPDIMAISATIIFVLAIVVTAAGPERRGEAFGEKRG